MQEYARGRAENANLLGGVAKGVQPHHLALARAQRCQAFPQELLACSQGHQHNIGQHKPPIAEESSGSSCLLACMPAWLPCILATAAGAQA